MRHLKGGAYKSKIGHMKTIRFACMVLVFVSLIALPNQTFGATQTTKKVVKTVAKPATAVAKKSPEKKVVAPTKKPVKKAVKKPKLTSKLIANPPLIDPNNPPGGPAQ
jgi:hypothetical protein